MNQAKIIQDIAEESLSMDLTVAKFKTYAKEHFLTYVRTSNDYLQYIKKNGQLLSLQLPEDKSELFIQADMAPYYWLCDTPVLLKYEEWLKTDARGKSILLEGYKTIKEFYSKWAIVKTDQEKKYYALSLMRMIDRDTNRNNFLKNILLSIILIYDSKLFSPPKAIELLEDTLKSLDTYKLNPELFNEIVYLLHLFIGFAHYKQLNFEDAAISFSEAMREKRPGITAKFYLALCDKRNGHPDSAAMLISEIIEYDRSVLQIAIEQNKTAVISYVLDNAYVYSVFNEPEFADLLDEIDQSIRLVLEAEGLTFEQVGSYLIRLDDLHFEEHYTDEIRQSIEFLDNACKGFMGNNSTIIEFTRPFLKDKLLRITTLIIESITNKYNGEIYEQLQMFDVGIDDNMEAIKHLTREAEEVKATYRKKLDNALKDIEEKMDAAVDRIEKRLENIGTLSEYNPQAAFNSSMVYNGIITLLVFIIGGFSGCYSNTIGNVYDYQDVMGVVLMSGGKWAAITFLIGMIISCFAGIFAYMERITEKQNLLRKIGFMKSQKEREIELVKREMQKKEQSVTENYNERIEEHKKTAASMKEEKEGKYRELKEMMDQKIKVFSDKLELIFS